MAYTTKNVIVGAAALLVSTRDSTSQTTTPGPPPVTTYHGILGAAGGGDVAAPDVPAGTAGQSLTDPASPLMTSADWRHVGFTDGGLTVTYTPTYTDVAVDQLLDSAKTFKTGLTVTVGTTMSEATLENLLVSWGQSGSVGANADGDDYVGIGSGELGDEPIERALVAVGPAPRNSAGGKRERVYHARRVQSVNASAHALQRAGATVFPVEFRLFPVPTGSNVGTSATPTTVAKGEEYGTVTDRVIG